MDTTVKDKTEKSPNFSFLSEHSPLLSQCAGRGKYLEYEVGVDDETAEAFIRISGNASSGAYSTKWIKLNDVRAILDNVEEDNFKAVVLGDLYAGQSSCNTGYLGAILKTLGVLVGVDKPPSALKIGSWDMLMEKITQLKVEGISLKDHIAIAAAEKSKKKKANTSRVKKKIA